MEEKPYVPPAKPDISKWQSGLEEYGILQQDGMGHELTTRMVTIGCARVSDLLELGGRKLANFDGDLRDLRDWVLTRATGVDEMTNGVFVGKFREIMNRYGVKYDDGSDDRRWNIDVRNKDLSVESRLRALVSDRRFWVFQAAGNHEFTLALDTMVQLCRWRKLF